MDLLVERGPARGGRLLGSLSIDGIFQCFTREKMVRADGLFIASETGLPGGNYNVQLLASRRYQRVLPLVASTLASSYGIRLAMWISPGRSFDDHEGGDIVLGEEQLGGSVARTRAAFDSFFQKLEAAVVRGEAIDLTIF